MLQFSRRISPSNLISKFPYYTNDATKFINTKVDDDTGYATVTLNKPPVNSLNIDILREFSATLTSLESQQVRGMILTSFSEKVFSAGLDITEFCPFKLDTFRIFWATMHDVWIKLYTSTFPTVAVINGHSPAGGCLLASSCEYRIMLRNFVIGFNETKLGFAAPPWVMKVFENVVGRRNAELAFTTGQLYPTDKAFQIGLIDEISENKTDALEQAKNFLNRYEMISQLARYESKKYFREKVVEDSKRNYEEESQNFIAMLQRPDVQKHLQEYKNKLKTNKEK